MDLKQFIEKRPYLYHLTSNENFKLIKKEGIIYSANKILQFANLDPTMFKVKRKEHLFVDWNGKRIMIRDQQPIVEKLLDKCLEDDWSCSDYYFYLNDRVFFWPTINRLERHFGRYESENPIIIRVSTEDVFQKNSNYKFARINSGATRANSYLGGIPPSRGKNTFQDINTYEGSIGNVAEVTFEGKCVLPKSFNYCRSPHGNWK